MMGEDKLMKFGTKKTLNFIKILNFLLLICLIASTNIGGCHNTNGSTETVTKIIGPDGGEINSADGLLTLIIPPGALTEDTEIAVTRFKELEGGENLLLYELLPDGLQFQIPATIRVNVKDLTGFMEGADDFIFPNLPLIVSREGDDFLALDMPTLDIDFDTGEAVLTANVNHFTGFVVGGKNGLEVSVNGVPFMTPANFPFGPVKVSVKNIGSTFSTFIETRPPISYKDTSQFPVLYQGGPNPLLLMPAPQSGQTQVYDINYSCGNPGLGKFVMEILFAVEKLVSKTVYTPGEINIAAAFVFDVAQADPEGTFDTVSFTKFVDYTISGSRLVECTGPTPIPTLTPTPTPTPTAEPVVDACDFLFGVYASTGTVESDPFNDAPFVNNPFQGQVFISENPDGSANFDGPSNIKPTGIPVPGFSLNECTVLFTGTGQAAGFNNVSLIVDLSFIMDSMGGVTFTGPADIVGNPQPTVGYQGEGVLTGVEGDY